MSAYLLANITVNNPENYKEYVSKVKSVVEKFGGEYLVRGGEMNIIEGDWPNERNIVIKFPSRETCKLWCGCHPEFSDAHPLFSRHW